MEEPLVPEPPPPGGGVQQRGHVVRGEGRAAGDGDTRAHLTRVTCLGRWLHYKQSHLECAAGDDVPGVADAGVVEEAGHGVDAATLVRAVLSCHGHIDTPATRDTNRISRLVSGDLALRWS